jgi:hypothetical protein
VVEPAEEFDDSDLGLEARCDDFDPRCSVLIVPAKLSAIALSSASATEPTEASRGV